jgi:hypothetical protein
MTKTFKSRDRKRTLLLLLCLLDRLPLGRLPRFTAAMVKQLDLSVIYIPYVETAGSGICMIPRRWSLFSSIFTPPPPQEGAFFCYG